MAANGSSKSKTNEEGDKIFCGVDLYVLPEGCIAAVISFSSPPDACRLASVSKIFKSAADSDSVWERFLPPDYSDFIARCDDGGAASLSSLSKKQLFFRLVDRPLLIDGGTKSFSLERTSGKKCFTLGARDLSITWGDTPRYWTWHSLPESRFPEVAELTTVCWLEIQGKVRISMLCPNTRYTAYFIFKMAEESYGFYHPAELVVKTAGGRTETRNVYLDPKEGQNQRYQIAPRRIGVFNRIRTAVRGMQPAGDREGDGNIPKPRGDGWLELEIGEFSTDIDEEGEVELSVLEVKAGNWKGGMIVEGIEIRPKVVKQ